MPNFNIGALRQLPPATFFADFRNGYTNEMVRLNTTRSTTVSTRVNNSGLIETVGANIPRLDYDPLTRAVKGLLVEPAAQNKSPYSENFNSWSKIRAVPTLSTEETPDGDTSSKYIKLVDDGGGGAYNAFVYRGITVSGNTKYTASVFAKADGVSYIKLLAHSSGDIASQVFGLTGDGVLGSPSGPIQDSSIEAYPNGWYRCSITRTTLSGDTSMRFDIGMASNATGAGVNMDGTSSVFVWGAQVETGPIATSYIPTTTASVTRNKDDISISSASGLIGQTEGTLYVEVDWRDASGTFQWLLSANNGTYDNRVFIYKHNSDELRMLARADGNTKTDQGGSSTGYSGIQKIAFAYKTDDFQLYRNGSSVSSDTSGSLASLATLTVIDIGQQGFGESQQANMWIRAVALFKKRLTDQQLQALTGN